MVLKVLITIKYMIIYLLIQFIQNLHWFNKIIIIYCFDKFNKKYGLKYK